MLFINTRTGNLIDARNQDVIEIMENSPIYEKVERAAAHDPAPEPKTGRAKKTAGKTAK